MSTPPGSPSVKRPLELAVRPDIPESTLPKRPKQDSIATGLRVEETDTSSPQPSVQEPLSESSNAASLRNTQNAFINAFMQLNEIDLGKIGDAVQSLLVSRARQTFHHSVPQDPSPTMPQTLQDPVLDTTAATTNAGSSSQSQNGNGTASASTYQPFPTTIASLHAAETYATGPQAELRRWKADDADLPNEANRWDTAQSFYRRLMANTVPAKHSHEWLVLVSWRLEWMIYDICAVGSIMPKHSDNTLNPNGKYKGEAVTGRLLAYKPRVEAVLEALDDDAIRKDVLDGVKNLEYVVVGAPIFVVKLKQAYAKNNKDRAEKKKKKEEEEAEAKATKAQLHAPAPAQMLVRSPATSAQTLSATVAADEDKSSGSTVDDDPMEIDAAAASPLPATEPSVHALETDLESVETELAALNPIPRPDKREAQPGTAALDPDNPAFISGIDEKR